MTSLLDKIELLIKREKTTPERKKKEEAAKSSSEILSELFSAFNADPPKIDEASLKKSKKSKKKHKKEKKKRSRSSSTSDSNDSDYSPKHKKRKKSKSKKKRDRSRSSTPSRNNIPPKIKADLEAIRIKNESGRGNSIDVRLDIKPKTEPKDVQNRRVSIKVEEPHNYSVDVSSFDASLIPMPDSPKHETDLRQKLDSKRQEPDDKSKSKIQIKNLKFSAVFEETVKKAEEEARKKAEKFEEGEYTDSSSSSDKPEVPNAEFPKSSDPGGILKKQAAEEIKVSDEDRSHSKRSKESSHKSSKRDRSRSRKRSSSKSRRSRSRSNSRRRRRSSSRSRSTRHSERHRRSRSRERERERHRPRHVSPRHRRRSRSPTGVKLADSEKKRLLEVARRNAINMLKNGAVPAGAAALPPHTRNQVMAAIQSGGKSVDELTDFCKHLSKKEALGELSSVSSHDEDMSENEDTLAFHHPFLVKEKAPIVMNIRGGAPLPIKSTILPIANKEELRLQFPVSSGSQHREKATEWVPVSPPKKDMQVAKLNSKATAAKPAAIAASETPAAKAPLALPAPVPAPAPLGVPAPLAALPAPAPAPAPASAPVIAPPPYLKSFTTGTQLASVPTVPALPAPGPQAYPPGIEPPKVIDVASIVSQKLLMIRKEQEKNELSSIRGSSIHQFGWSTKAGQFTGSTGAQILTPKELASGTQAWAKKDQLMRAAPVGGGMGMHLLQKMGWTPGQGLGKEGTGTLQPLLLEVKLDTRGLQAKEEMKVQRQPRRGGAAPAIVAGGKHPVSLLGEYCSKQKLGPPEYNLCFECGPDHKKNFLFKVRVAGTEYQPAVASANKKQAKADAAQLALQKLGICP